MEDSHLKPLIIRCACKDARMDNVLLLMYFRVGSVADYEASIGLTHHGA